MKKILLMLMMVGVILTGCSTSKSADEMKILTPNGAPALSLVGVYEDVTKNGKINIVEGSDLVSSELMKADSEYDCLLYTSQDQ